ncbi:MAG: translation initiation factor IF-2 [Candidatus Omnitrophota bacterium]
MVKKIAKKDAKEVKEKAKRSPAKSVAAKPKAKKAVGGISPAASAIKKKTVGKSVRTEPADKKRAVQPKPAPINVETAPKEAGPRLKAVKVVPAPAPKIEDKPAEKAEAILPPRTKVELKPVTQQKLPAAVPAQAAPPLPAKDAVIEITVVEKAAPPKAEKPAAKVLEFDLPIPLKDFAVKLGIKPNEIILDLMSKNIFATINQNLGEELVVGLLKARGIEFRKPVKLEEQASKEHTEMEAKQDLRHITVRPPVVTFMGHVDHGKTSLLDFIRKTRVADKEKGGITQHIGAYEVRLKNGSVTFLDTPGHEAFTAMRARGANATDIVVLVVAADDGVMPQTKEALDHARASGVTIMVALNKCDLPSANIDKVKGQLNQIGLNPEDWGGKTIVVPVSAKTGEGVDSLLEMLLLEAELLELKANPQIRARGVVIEGKLSSAQGPVATVLVKNGTLKLGDMVLTGMHYGRVKAMMDHTGKRVETAPPSKPVTLLGLSGVPMAGDEFFVVKDEKKARVLSALKQDEARSRKMKMSHRVTLEDFYSKMKEGVAKELAILLKGDVQGSVEAIKASLLELNTKDVKVAIIHADVGNVSESDIMLAMASNAIIMGFNVKIDEGASDLADKEDIEIKSYNIIYEAIEDVKAGMEGLLAPVEKEVLVGRALVKQPFRVTKVGTIAGSQVVRGKIVRTGIAKLIRDKQVVYQGKISSLKRFKDDVREVNEGVECGIGLSGHDDIKTGDLIEVYQIEKIARRLDARK